MAININNLSISKHPISSTNKVESYTPKISPKTNSYFDSSTIVV
jgi:hypothetical protein